MCAHASLSFLPADPLTTGEASACTATPSHAFDAPGNRSPTAVSDHNALTGVESAAEMLMIAAALVGGATGGERCAAAASHPVSLDYKQSPSTNVEAACAGAAGGY